MDIDKIIEFADNILKNSDISQKRNGLANLTKKLQSDFPDVIPFINSEIKQFPRWRYADYKDEIYTGHIGDTKKKMLKFVNEHFSDITQYEADNKADLEMRKRKLQEYAQVVSISPGVKRTNIGIEYEYSPDRIYVQNGIYRKYWNYKNDPYFIFALYLRKAFNNYDFLDLSKKVFLYISLKNELNQVEEEMELLGINICGREGNYGISDCKYPIKDEYKPIIAILYQELNGLAFSLTESAFGTAIESANLSGAHNQKGSIKNKLQYMIYILSKVMGSDWYTEASNSIGSTKNKCSGANVEDDMKRLKGEVEKMKAEIDKKR